MKFLGALEKTRTIDALLLLFWTQGFTFCSGGSRSIQLSYMELFNCFGLAIGIYIILPYASDPFDKMFNAVIRRQTLYPTELRAHIHLTAWKEYHKNHAFARIILYEKAC